MPYKNTLYIFILFLLWNCSSENKPIANNSYAGSWICEESSSLSETQSYIVRILIDTKDTSQYYIFNFRNLGENVMLAIKNDGFTITKSQQPTSGPVITQFHGSCKPYNELKLDFSVFNGDRDVTYNSVYTHK